MIELTQQEIAAMWLYHEDYATLGIGAIYFYKQLPQHSKNLVDDMIREIEKAKHIRKTRKTK